MNVGIPHAVDTLQLFADPTRLRLVALLAREELTVSELTAVTELGQSRVSTHLARLKEAGVLRDRREGVSTRYAIADDTMPGGVRALWELLRASLEDPVLDADRRRCEALVRGRGATWPDAVAGHMERHYSPGRTWEALSRALLGLVELGDVLDMGSGDGTVAALLAPRARQVTCLDRRARVAEAAARRLAAAPNVCVVVGDAEAVPSADARFDVVLAFNVLTCCTHPARAVAEAARVLRPGGRTVIVTLATHQHGDVAAAYGHVHAGCAPARLRRWLGRAGLAVQCCQVTSREPREPHFEVVTAFASKPGRREKGCRS